MSGSDGGDGGGLTAGENGRAGQVICSWSTQEMPHRGGHLSRVLKDWWERDRFYWSLREPSPREKPATISSSSCRGAPVTHPPLGHTWRCGPRSRRLQSPAGGRPPWPPEAQSRHHTRCPTGPGAAPPGGPPPACSLGPPAVASCSVTAACWEGSGPAAGGAGEEGRQLVGTTLWGLQGPLGSRHLGTSKCNNDDHVYP